MIINILQTPLKVWLLLIQHIESNLYNYVVILCQCLNQVEFVKLTSHRIRETITYIMSIQNLQYLDTDDNYKVLGRDLSDMDWWIFDVNQRGWNLPKWSENNWISILIHFNMGIKTKTFILFFDILLFVHDINLINSTKYEIVQQKKI